jgi:NADPH:quinone reductase-like Zn-dependent oxidoreductase
VVKASDLAKIPDGMGVLEVAALPLVTTTGAQLAELATRGRERGTVLVTGAVGNVGRSAIFTAKASRWFVIAGVRKKQMEEAKAAGADRVIALDDEMSLRSLEPLDAIADTISGPIADQLVGKVKKGGVFASVLRPPSNAAAHPDISVETMRAKPAPATLAVMAEAVRTGKLVIPLGQRFPLSEAGKAHREAERGAAGKLLLVL